MNPRPWSPETCCPLSCLHHADVQGGCERAPWLADAGAAMSPLRCGQDTQTMFFKPCIPLYLPIPC